MSVGGQFTEDMIPARAQGKSIGVGTSGDYTCLIWSTG
jgi:hypothetical protein